MGRKIPTRKHHGIRDPEKQAAERFNRIKDKINAPPKNPDAQEVSKSLQRIIDLKNKTKAGDFNKKRREKRVNEKKNNKQNTPVFKQRPNESNRQFIHRVNLICMDVQRETQFETKYGIEIKRNELGEVESVAKRPKDEVELMMKQIRKEKKEKKIKKKTKNKSDTENTEKKLTKSQKWQKKKKEKLMKKKTSNSDIMGEDTKDTVKFGEIVHAPPTLVAPRKAEKVSNAARPGKKNLLLKNMLSSQESTINLKSKPNSNSHLRKVSNKSIDKKGRRKDLPNALRRQLEQQQQEIISAYKQLKNKQYNTK